MGARYGMSTSTFLLWRARAQRTHKEEFYELVDLPATIGELRQLLLRQEQTYNTVRPHQALGQITPWAWLRHHQKQKTDGSQMAVARSPLPNPYRTTERRSL
jgi:hypothetical protein